MKKTHLYFEKAIHLPRALLQCYLPMQFICLNKPMFEQDKCVAQEVEHASLASTKPSVQSQSLHKLGVVAYPVIPVL